MYILIKSQDFLDTNILLPFYIYKKKIKFLLRIILLGKSYFYLPYDTYFLNSIKDNWSSF